MTPAGTSNELDDVQNEWEKTHTHMHSSSFGRDGKMFSDSPGRCRCYESTKRAQNPKKNLNAPSLDLLSIHSHTGGGNVKKRLRTVVCSRDMVARLLSIVVDDSHIQRIVLATE